VIRNPQFPHRSPTRHVNPGLPPCATSKTFRVTRRPHHLTPFVENGHLSANHSPPLNTSSFSSYHASHSKDRARTKQMPSPITVQASNAKGRVAEGVRGMCMHNPFPSASDDGEDVLVWLLATLTPHQQPTTTTTKRTQTYVSIILYWHPYGTKSDLSNKKLEQGGRTQARVN
jgi:hypothetical protein